MIPNEGIADNLYALYGELAEKGLVASGKAGGFEFVRHEGFAWPNMAYRPGRSGPVGRAELKVLKESMASGSCPKLLVIDGEGMTEEVRGALAEERFIGATEWINMALPVGPVAGAGKDGLLECRKIDADDPEEWGRWASVVSGVLFKNVALDPLLFCQQAIKKKFTLITGYADGEAVATCLLYFGTAAGLYMVATLPKVQGKGYGRRLMEYAQAEAVARGYKYVVLHSTKAGLNFYNRLGFSSFGKLFLYYSMQ
jgi:ribosomal protein S18 acetylase RimI-like enzyme